MNDPLNDTNLSTSSTDSIDFTTVSYDTTVVPTQVDDLKITTTANLVDTETTTTATDITDINDNTNDNNGVNCSHCLNAKYFNHYYAKGCKPVFGDNRCKDCPKMFDCIEKIEIELGNNECLFNGSKFTIGERIPVPNPCQVCQCGYGYTHRVDSQPFTTIHCVSVECPENFAVHSFPLAGLERDFERVHNCYNVYESGKCCAVSKKSRLRESPQLLQRLREREVLRRADPVDEEFVCQYNGKSYRLGEKIHPIDDKCKVCVCDQSWNSNKTSDNSGCRAVQCNLEVDRQLRDGCLPIYHENTCCPVDYYCR
ncbi:unnamed protein product [Medioppia subpectinata]|uniref:VWFC domain-containing protein n=1 Tax=Medioppia subpectinata TaxID=1979941 RepID=A0A7R9LHE8_9ACAR|nr:unnamed protein product [Medioppia subpectinata]CAG2118883.1 unnamed protein product [Medioppia subpectinata]